MSVVIIHHDIDVVIDLKMFLEKAGKLVTWFPMGSAAFDAWRFEPDDVVLVDLLMGGYENGADNARIIKLAIPNSLCIGITEHDTPEARNVFEGVKADGFWSQDQGMPALLTLMNTLATAEQ